MPEQQTENDTQHKAEEQTPPWGEDFDPQRAWNLVQNLRGDKATLQGELTQAQANQAELETLRREKMTASEVAIAEAREQAAAEARAAVEAEYRPQLLAKELKATAGQVIAGDQLKAFLEIADPAKFVGSDGNIDEEKVMGHLTGLYGRERQFGSGLPQHRDWGQNSGQPPGKTGADMGLAEAHKRFGTKQT